MVFLLGLDVGDKRVGIALGDSTVRIAFPEGCYNRAKGQAEARILELIEEKSVKELVVGIPLSDSGEETAQATKIRSFCRRLERRTGITPRFVDENSTSFEAEQRLNLRGEPPSKKGGMIDAVAASIILQNFFDSSAVLNSNGDNNSGSGSRSL